MRLNIALNYNDKTAAFNWVLADVNLAVFRVSTSPPGRKNTIPFNALMLHCRISFCSVSKIA